MITLLEKIQKAFTGQTLNNHNTQQNIQKLQSIMSNPPTPEHLYAMLNAWEGQSNLEIHNYTFGLGLALGGFTFLLAFMIHPAFILLSFISIIYAFIKRTPLTTRKQTIQDIQNYWLEQKYKIHFQNQLDNINSSSPLTFPYFHLGNHDNEIRHCIYGQWQIQNHTYPFMLFNYHYVDKDVDRDEDGKETVSYDHHDLYGVLIENFPARGISISTQQKRASRLGVKWTSGDIKFDQSYQLSGIHEVSLAKFFSPQNILHLEIALQEFKGDFYIHPQTSTLCWLFKTDITDISDNHASIKNIHELAEHLHDLNMPELEKMTQIMQKLIPELQKE